MTRTTPDAVQILQQRPSLTNQYTARSSDHLSLNVIGTCKIAASSAYLDTSRQSTKQYPCRIQPPNRQDNCRTTTDMKFIFGISGASATTVRPSDETCQYTAPIPEAYGARTDSYGRNTVDSFGITAMFDKNSTSNSTPEPVHSLINRPPLANGYNTRTGNNLPKDISNICGIDALALANQNPAKLLNQYQNTTRTDSQCSGRRSEDHYKDRNDTFGIAALFDANSNLSKRGAQSTSEMNSRHYTAALHSTDYCKRTGVYLREIFHGRFTGHKSNAVQSDQDKTHTYTSLLTGTYDARPGDYCPGDRMDNADTASADKKAVHYFASKLETRNEDWVSIFTLFVHRLEAPDDIRKCVECNKVAGFKNWLTSHHNAFQVEGDMVRLKTAESDAVEFLEAKLARSQHGELRIAYLEDYLRQAPLEIRHRVGGTAGLWSWLCERPHTFTISGEMVSLPDRGSEEEDSTSAVNNIEEMGNDEDDVFNEAVVYFKHILSMKGGELSISSLTGHLSQASRSVQKYIASYYGGLENWLFRHPHTFQIDAGRVSLQPDDLTDCSSVDEDDGEITSYDESYSNNMYNDNDDSDDGFDEAVAYFQNILAGKGGELSISSLAGHLSQASESVRKCIVSGHGLKNWLVRHPQTFQFDAGRVSLLQEDHSDREDDFHDANSEAVRYLTTILSMPNKGGEMHINSLAGHLNRANDSVLQCVRSGFGFKSWLVHHSHAFTVSGGMVRLCQEGYGDKDDDYDDDHDDDYDDDHSDAAAVRYFKTILSNNGDKLHINSLHGHRSQARDYVRERVGKSKCEFKDWLAKNSQIFKVFDDFVDLLDDDFSDADDDGYDDFGNSDAVQYFQSILEDKACIGQLPITSLGSYIGSAPADIRESIEDGGGFRDWLLRHPQDFVVSGDVVSKCIFDGKLLLQYIDMHIYLQYLTRFFTLY
jgi:hypothetical protein